MNKTTKSCPDCGNKNLVKLSSYAVKICVECNKTITWYLDKGQKPLH